MQHDHIRETIITRAEEVGLTAYAIAKQAELNPGTVKRYLTGQTQLTSERIAAVCTVLGLELRPTKRGRK